MHLRLQCTRKYDWSETKAATLYSIHCSSAQEEPVQDIILLAGDVVEYATNKAGCIT